VTGDFGVGGYFLDGGQMELAKAHEKKSSGLKDQL
jgi:hypothetical protein